MLVMTLGHIGDRIKLARELRGFSQNKLDEMCELSQGTTSRNERGDRGMGRRGMGVETLMRYAGALSVRPEWLLTNSGPMEDVAASDAFPRRALAVRIAREGGIHERAIQAVLALKIADAENKTTLWWIEAMRAREAILEQDAEAASSQPVSISRRKHSAR